MPYEFERTQRIAVLGGGPGGYEAALAGAQLGAEVTLVERVGVGGSAVITDVVPSKSLIATAEATNAIGEAADLGVQFFTRHEQTNKPVRPEVAVNLATVNKRLLGLARQQSEDMRANLVHHGVRIVQGDGRLDGSNALIVATAPGDEGMDFDRIEADTIVVSVGASPRILPSAAPDGERIMSWTQLYNLKTVPEHLIVVGSGVTGAEFASAYRALGAKVTLISSRDQVLPGEDADAAAVIENVFKRNGMVVLSKSRADRVERTETGVRAVLSDGRVVEGSHCLMAVGSIPNTAGIGLEEAGVQLTESGHIRVNRVARTSVPSIYAAGDCTTFLPLASVAAMQGRTGVFHAMGDAVNPTEVRNVAANIFTQPEIATVGWSQKEIEEGLAQGEIYKLPLAANPRAKMMGIRDGFVKVFARTGSGTVIGGVIVAPKASELIFPLALAVEHRLTVDQVARAFTVYPSLTGSISEAARAMHIVG
ncbi:MULTISPECIES: NAD(P)H-quinone dehydrogenase [Rathayibacter]|jgi:dihydrolipoamide dehydrogenase|uniref:NAD(P)H-quinone dehydrogenase n=2 Tax=Rathayibacter festucae TaxID=110937 RepID=A0A3T0SXF1_9MICO|nr:MULTISPECIES: NAD(P)H-quinone dehydrogenase [Rathayibacter]AZZ50989.1 NAD(P)H-quinone dehydrogenase [Rathayibacter festucae DSM 15932]MCJ1672720.1 NAD(P)H-quinone dehydrogenase [Rathayibacter sp. VKM Ac-2929]MCJ1682199.1 NAD(P)H-quinone dehydrogenase [Rathayibacter sp. VKM Ac-2928]MCJ1685858.1 NAD(P)H-quinone dehydrogenase [Rathayibacter sp. VKM Ac-2927]MCJ1704768.1 NAD(P)H-quinone dehydrogenase [Rathayibacter sp. VKM Ac-2926]